MCKGASPLQLSKYRILVCEQVANKAVVVPLVHGQRRLLPWTENARGKSISKRCHISFIGRSQFDEAGEVSANGVQSGNVSKAELSERRLQDGDACVFSYIRGSGAVDGFDDFVYMRRDERVYAKSVSRLACVM